MESVRNDAAAAWGAASVATDGEIVARVRDGALDEFEALVRRYEPGLHRYLARLTGCAADAEDIAQAAFVRAYRRLATFRREARFSPWLFAIARRMAIDLLRRRRTHAPLDEAAGVVAAAAAAPAGDLWEWARTALSERAFTALWLRYVEDCSVRDIARRMRMSTPAVKVALHRARRQLARAWRTEERGGAPAVPVRVRGRSNAT